MAEVTHTDKGNGVQMSLRSSNVRRTDNEQNFKYRLSCSKSTAASRRWSGSEFQWRENV